MNHENIDLILKGIPAFCAFLMSFLARIDPATVNPWVSLVVGCLAGLYYVKMIFLPKKDKKP